MNCILLKIIFISERRYYNRWVKFSPLSELSVNWMRLRSKNNMLTFDDTLGTSVKLSASQNSAVLLMHTQPSGISSIAAWIFNRRKRTPWLVWKTPHFKSQANLYYTHNSSEAVLDRCKANPSGLCCQNADLQIFNYWNMTLSAPRSSEYFTYRTAHDADGCTRPARCTSSVAKCTRDSY